MASPDVAYAAAGVPVQSPALTCTSPRSQYPWSPTLGPVAKICNNGGLVCKCAYKLHSFDCTKIQRPWSCFCAIRGINPRINWSSRSVATSTCTCSLFSGASHTGAIARVLDWASAISRACLPAAAYACRGSDRESVCSSLQKAPEIQTGPLYLWRRPSGRLLCSSTRPHCSDMTGPLSM